METKLKLPFLGLGLYASIYILICSIYLKIYAFKQIPRLIVVNNDFVLNNE